MKPFPIRVAEVAGANAFKDGLHMDDNPYPFGSPRRPAWERGYARAEQSERERRAFLQKIRREQRRAKAG